jgi:3-dehydroquinate synthase
MIDDVTVSVALGARSYDIIVGENLLAQAGALAAPLLRQPRVVIVTDENVAPLYAGVLEAAFDEVCIAHETSILPAGESTKDFANFQHLAERVLAGGIERGTTLVALGGGVIGDITGFAAAVLLRGLDFIQIPTTLLSQVDSSVGGKTGINTAYGKNLVGAFHQPRLVLCDIEALNTLPERELQAGYAEVVKYGLIDDAPFFEWLQENGTSLCSGDMLARQRAVVTSCEAKAAIVAEDEKEVGRRALLNFGHTFGHALEAEAGYGDTLLHGEAVSIGMVMAFVLSARLGHCAPGTVTVVRDHLRQVGLPVSTADRPSINWNAVALLGHMAKDKKVTDGAITFVLAREIGDAFLSSDVGREMLIGVLEDGGAS